MYSKFCRFHLHSIRKVAIVSKDTLSKKTFYNLPIKIVCAVIFLLISYSPAHAWNGTKGYVGAIVKNAELGGALIFDLQYGAAFRYGLRPGDIIRRVDSLPIQNIEQFISAVSGKPAGTATTIGYLRPPNTTLSYQTIVLGTRPVLGASPAILGLGVGSKEEGREGIPIVDVLSESIASKSNLRVGDMILAAYPNQINSTYNFLSSIRAAIDENRKSILLLISRNGERVFVTLGMPSASWKQGPSLPSGNFDYRFMDWVSLGNWTVKGRLVENRKLWTAYLKSSGSVEFHTSSGNVLYGNYRVRNNSICIQYPPDNTEYCRTPQMLDGRIAWYQEEADRYQSELVSVQRRPDVLPKAPQVSQRRPKACRDTTAFCTKLSLGAAACGWAGQKAADTALKFDTGRAGSAVSGAACQAIASEVAGLEVDLLDLAIAATSSALIGGAERSFSEGDFWGGLLQGTLGVTAGIAGLAKCEATLKTACR